MKRVLVSGGCGFLGSHLVDRLLLRTDVESVVVVDNMWTGTRANLAHVSDPRLSIEQCDAESFATETRFDEIIHMASPASPPWYMREPLRVIKANVHGALNLLNLLKRGGRFSYSSTSEVYGDPLVSPQPESYRGSVDCTGPRSSYDESKRCTEALLFESQRVSGLDVRVVRLFNVYGPRTRIDDGRAVSNFIGQALTTGELTVYGDGQQSRSWGYVDDIVEALARFFWRDEFDYRGPLNVGNDREIPVIDIAKYITQLVPGTRIKYLPAIPQDPTNRRPDLTVMNRVLPGWNAAIPYEEGVRRTLDWFKSQIETHAEPPKAPEPILLNGLSIPSTSGQVAPADTNASRPRIALITAGSPFDRRSWSGIPFYVHRELSRRYGAVRVVDTPRLDWIVSKISRKLPMGLFLAREPIVTGLYRRLVAKRLSRVGADLVVSIGAPHKVVDLPPAWPVIHFEDADFETIVSYYPTYQRVNARSRTIGREVQRRLLTRASSILVSSEWAAHAAAQNSGVPEPHFLIAPMGANLDDDPGTTPLRSNRGELSLLFVGYDWERKGGPIVLAAFSELKRRLGRVTLHVVGASPKEALGVEGVVVHGALRKSIPEERDRLTNLFRNASFFFMPSRAEPYGLVYCEACAFGLPPVATDTGGVGTIIKHGVNGLLLPESASGCEYARAIESVWKSSERYAAMQARAREAFEGRLNWRAWGDVLNDAIRSELATA